jgi:hypothetical protein
VHEHWRSPGKTHLAGFFYLIYLVCRKIVQFQEREKIVRKLWFLSKGFFSFPFLKWGGGEQA